MRALRTLVARLAALPRPAGAALTAGWVALIWLRSAAPPSDLAVGSRAGAWVTNLAHAPEYAALATWLAIAVRPRGAPLAATAGVRALVWAACVAHGLGDELHQSFVPGRDASLLDVVTDACGAATALAVLAGLGPVERGGRALRTLALGAAACAAAAALATFLPTLFPETTWL